MLRIKSGNVREALESCYRLASPNVGGKAAVAVGSGSRSTQLQRQLDLVVASRVLSFVDRDLRGPQAQMVRFCFESADNYPDFAALTLFAWEGVQGELLDGRAAQVREGLSSLRLLAPWEARHRVFNPGQVLHSGGRLADLLGMNRSSFSRRYQAGWEAMVVLLLDALIEACVAVEVFVNRLVTEKNYGGAPLRINGLGSLSGFFEDNFEKAA